MQIEEILCEFNETRGSFPLLATFEALALGESITPTLLSILDDVLKNYKHIKPDNMDYLFALFILSAQACQQVFPYIIALASLPNDWPENLLGDCITESLPRMIASTYNGDISLVYNMIENEKINVWSRSAGINGLLALVANKYISRDSVIEYFRKLFNSSFVNNEEFTAMLIQACIDLYPEELLPEIKKAFANDMVEEVFVNIDDVKYALTVDKKIALQRNLINNVHYRPIEDVKEAMEWMAAFQADDDFTFNLIDEINSDDSRYINHEQHERIFLKIGRNEPCICGSGKKFKKCCMDT